MAVAGLVLGIVSLAFMWVPALNFIAAIVGIVLSYMGTKQLRAAGQPTGIATAGLVLSIVGLVFAVVGTIFCVPALCASCSAVNDLSRLGRYF